jgi:5-formyltetrahydrofolate cyclo-ligase
MPDPLEISQTKITSRQQAKTYLADWPREAISHAIAEHLAGWQMFQQASCVLTYSALPDEPNLSGLMSQFPDKAWYLPRVATHTQTMRFHHVQDASQLTPNRWGITEPTANAPTWEPTLSEKSLMLLPGLMFDRDGYRLGRGKGYYDRFLTELKTTGYSIRTAGVIAEGLLVPALARHDWDIAVSAVITETGVVLTSS